MDAVKWPVRGIYTDSDLQQQSDQTSFIFSDRFEATYVTIGKAPKLSRVQLYANAQQCNVSASDVTGQYATVGYCSCGGILISNKQYSNLPTMLLI